MSYEAWQTNFFGGTNSPLAERLADPDAAGAKNYLEYLTGTNPTNAASAWGISITASNGLAHILIPQPANRGVEVQMTTNLLAADAWQPLNLPANAPFFPATQRDWSVAVPASSPTPHFHRVRVFEP